MKGRYNYKGKYLWSASYVSKQIGWSPGYVNGKIYTGELKEDEDYVKLDKNLRDQLNAENPKQAAGIRTSKYLVTNEGFKKMRSLHINPNLAFEGLRTNDPKIKEELTDGTPVELPEPERNRKMKYAENVSMTKEEYRKLVEQYGSDKAIKAIEKLNNYKGAHGRKYKSDYRAILSWAIDNKSNEESPKVESLKETVIRLEEKSKSLETQIHKQTQGYERRIRSLENEISLLAKSLESFERILLSRQEVASNNEKETLRNKMKRLFTGDAQ